MPEVFRISKRLEVMGIITVITFITGLLCHEEKLLTVSIITALFMILFYLMQGVSNKGLIIIQAVVIFFSILKILWQKL